MLAALVAMLTLGQVPPPPPPDLTPDPMLREARMESVVSLNLRGARIFVAKRDGRAIEMTGDVREDFLALLERPETHSDVPGVMGCIAKQYVVTVVFPMGARESWFCVGCQRIMPMWPDDGLGFDAVLSPEGAGKIERVFERAIRWKNKRPADAGRCH